MLDKFHDLCHLEITCKTCMEALAVVYNITYRIIPNRSTGCLNKSLEGGYIRFREPGATVTNMIYKRNRTSKLGGAFIRSGAFIGDNTVHKCDTLSRFGGPLSLGIKMPLC